MGTVTLAVLVAPACSSNPARGLCRDVCGCEGCSNSEEETCFEAADEAQQQAESEGCTEELDAYVDCRKDAFKCTDGRAQFTEDCGPEANDLIECGGVPPASDACRAAAQICGVQGEGEGECTGASQCAAQCIVTANSCDFANDPDLTDCLTSC